MKLIVISKPVMGKRKIIFPLWRQVSFWENNHEIWL